MAGESASRRGWPTWAKAFASVALGAHLAAMLAAAFASEPASVLELRAAGWFGAYYQLIDQGYSYRYYAPEPPPTPVIEARLRFADGRAEQIIRLPDRAVRPRMLYQRQLALANHLFNEHESEHPHWGPSYARHLGRVHGCREVAFFYQMHLIPPLGMIQRRLEEQPDGPPIDLDAPEFYSELQLMGTYPCDTS